MSQVETTLRGRPSRGVGRAIRRWLIPRGTDFGLGVARVLPNRGIDFLEKLVAALGPLLPIVARNVRANMRAVDVYSRQAHRDYFANVAFHLTGAMHIWRIRAASGGSAEVPASLHALLDTRFHLDESITRLQDARARGQRIILVGPHLSGYLLSVAQLNLALPLSVYMRVSKQQRRRTLQEHWMNTIGLRRLVDPERESNPTFVMAGAVRRGDVLYVTPDLPRKRGDGAAVRFFDREIYLPAGMALVARRAGAALYFLKAHREGSVFRLGVNDPFEPPPRTDKGLSFTSAAMQWFADQLQQFLIDDPGVWYFWADKRWTRVFRGDSRYVRLLGGAPGASPGKGDRPSGG